jgi:hypothetical protein
LETAAAAKIHIEGGGRLMEHLSGGYHQTTALRAVLA